MNLARKLAQRGIVLLDGALATELEARGLSIEDALWSARVLADAPAVLGEVHRAYLEAGADCIETAGYQASVPGFVAAGYSAADAERLVRDAVRIAFEARAAFCTERGIARADEPLIAASFGPFGAFLADGSEYRGRYAASAAELETFHRERLALVWDELRSRSGRESERELLAFETIPSLPEARLLARLTEELEGAEAWISFACKSGAETCEGQAIEACAEALEPFDSIVALGVNCTAPRFVPELLERLRGASSKPLVAYPNSGEHYDVSAHGWTGAAALAGPDAVAREAETWSRAGARVIGGCCRTSPATIARLATWRDA